MRRWAHVVIPLTLFTQGMLFHKTRMNEKNQKNKNNNTVFPRLSARGAYLKIAPQGGALIRGGAYSRGALIKKSPQVGFCPKHLQAKIGKNCHFFLEMTNFC